MLQKITLLKISTTTSIYLFIASCLLILLLGLGACKKFVDVPLPEKILTTPQVFADDATATSAVSGIYSSMIGGPSLPTSNLTTLYAGLCADEIYNYTVDFRNEFLENNITQLSHGAINTFFWNPFYNFIYTANLCLEGLDKSTAISQVVKNQLKGEALFIRAFSYFHLVNLFGEVPLVLTSDYTINAMLPRTNKNEIYTQLIADLVIAKDIMMDNPAAERARPSKWAAMALLARLYLYTGQWQLAENVSSQIINNTNFSLLSDLDNVFVKNSNETIWQIKPVSPNQNTWEGNRVLPASATETPKYVVTTTLLNSFSSIDKRKSFWLGSRVFGGEIVYYPKKYKVVGNGAPLTEYYIVFRLAEIYLIRAEARAQLDLLNEALSDLNKIRIRAGLSSVVNGTPALTKNDLLSLIEQERRLELFIEWGHRWYDLKRTGRVDAVLSVLKPSSWQPTDALWPIPINQLTVNPNLTQNNGY